MTPEQPRLFGEAKGQEPGEWRKSGALRAQRPAADHEVPIGFSDPDLLRLWSDDADRLAQTWYGATLLGPRHLWQAPASSRRWTRTGYTAPRATPASSRG